MAVKATNRPKTDAHLEAELDARINKGVVDDLSRAFDNARRILATLLESAYRNERDYMPSEWHDEIGEDADVYRAMIAASPEPPVSDGMTQAVRDVLDERQRQIAKGWTADHDDGHANSEIINEWFGARERLWKATLKTPPDRQLLVEAAAQVIAEIERVDRIPGQSEIIAARVNGEQKS